MGIKPGSNPSSSLPLDQSAKFCFIVVIVFLCRTNTFFQLFKVRLHFIGCINHDIVVELCSELLMRLSIYNVVTAKKLVLLRESYSSLFNLDPLMLPLDHSHKPIVVVFLFFCCCCNCCCKSMFTSLLLMFFYFLFILFRCVNLFHPLLSSYIGIGYKEFEKNCC